MQRTCRPDLSLGHVARARDGSLSLPADDSAFYVTEKIEATRSDFIFPTPHQILLQTTCVYTHILKDANMIALCGYSCQSWRGHWQWWQEWKLDAKASVGEVTR